MMNMMNFQILLVLMTSVHAPPPHVIPLSLNHRHIHLYHCHQCNAIMVNTITVIIIIVSRVPFVPKALARSGPVGFPENFMSLCQHHHHHNHHIVVVSKIVVNQYRCHNHQNFQEVGDTYIGCTKCLRQVNFCICINFKGGKIARRSWNHENATRLQLCNLPPQMRQQRNMNIFDNLV